MFSHFYFNTTTIDFNKVMYSHNIQYRDLKKSCIHVTYHKSCHYLTLMTVDSIKIFMIEKCSHIFVESICKHGKKKTMPLKI